MIKHLFILLLVVLFALPTHGQPVQKLKERFEQAETPDEKAQIAYNWASRVRKRNPQGALGILKRVIDRADKVEDAGVMSTIYLLQGELLDEIGQQDGAKKAYTTGFQLAARNKIGDVAIACLNALEKNAIASGNYRQAYEYSELAVNFLAKNKNIKAAEIKSVPIQEPIGDSDLKSQLEAYREREKNWLAINQDLEQVNSLAKARNLFLADSLTRLQEQLNIREMLYTGEISESEARRLERKADQALKKARAETERNQALEAQLDKTSAELTDLSTKSELQQYALYLLAALAFFVFSIALLFYGRYRAKKRSSKALEEKNKIIEEERQRSDELLLNILPANIAKELKDEGQAKPRRYNEVTVLFSDFKNFSIHAQHMKPEDLVNELDTAFKSFDYIISQYKIEKIKTIGDAYMCASGFENDGKMGAIEMVRAALDMQEYLDDIKRERISRGLPYFEARIGIHTGPVVTGVVGIKKFAFDIWGDTVNIASRVENKSETGKVNISEATYNLVRNQFLCRHRGKMSIKNKGVIDMYFVEGG